MTTWSTSSADNVSLSARTGTNVTLTANSVTSEPVTITAQEAYSQPDVHFEGERDRQAVPRSTSKHRTTGQRIMSKVHYQTTNDDVWTDINMTRKWMWLLQQLLHMRTFR